MVATNPPTTAALAALARVSVAEGNLDPTAAVHWGLAEPTIWASSNTAQTLLDNKLVAGANPATGLLMNDGDDVVATFGSSVRGSKKPLSHNIQAGNQRIASNPFAKRQKTGHPRPLPKGESLWRPTMNLPYRQRLKG